MDSRLLASHHLMVLGLWFDKFDCEQQTAQTENKNTRLMMLIFLLLYCSQPLFTWREERSCLSKSLPFFTLECKLPSLLIAYVKFV